MNPARKFYLQQYAQENYQHGGQGYVDMERILEQEGYMPCRLEENGGRSRILNFRKRFLQLRRIVKNASKADEWVFIFPVYGRMNRWLLRRLQRKSCQLIGIVADIDGLKDAEEGILREDIAFLSKLPKLVVHNQAMSDWLVSVGCKADMAKLEFFDFLQRPSAASRGLENKVAFAGNLAKSRFLLDPSISDLDDIQIAVYGPGLEISSPLQKNLHFKGTYDPSDLIEKLEGSFGLVWDGDSWQSPGGPLGHYMAYITHHKISLYILAGLPILIPRMAGAAPRVEQYGIGIVFDNTADIPAAIKKLSEESYQAMRQNMVKLAEQLSKGQQLRNALATLHRQEA
jgi:hypothetical protein